MAVLLSVNIGTARPIAAKSGMSGIYKTPTQGPVEITADGLSGDNIVDTANHGGVDQAVYAYCRADYDWWEGELKLPLAPGHFGENLTLDGLESADFSVGDRLEIGNVVLEVSAPRVPCVTIGVRMGDLRFVKTFHEAGRPGPYFRVLEGGTVEAGMPVRHVPWKGSAPVPIAELRTPLKIANLSEAERERLLAVPIHGSLRRALTEPG